MSKEIPEPQIVPVTPDPDKSDQPPEPLIIQIIDDEIADKEHEQQVERIIRKRDEERDLPALH